MAPLALVALAPLGNVRKPQRAALVALYEATDGANWNQSYAAEEPWNGTARPTYGGNHNWDVRPLAEGGSDPCSRNNSARTQWFGVGCYDPCETWRDGDSCFHGDIVSLELPFNNLAGSVPPSVLATLTEITVLDLAHNTISGTIPTEIGRLSLLGEVRLKDNSLSGTIPTQVQTIGTNVPRDSYMYHLDDVDCSLPRVDPRPGYHWSAPLPCTYSGRSGAGPSIFDVGNNRLNGTLPTTMGALANLRIVDVSHNDELGAVCCTDEYSRLDRYFYDYATAVPTEMGTLNKLAYLRLHDSQFLRHVPTELGSLRSLIMWDAAGNGSHASNQISGTLPTQIGRLSITTRMANHHNQLSGTLPTQIVNMSELTHFELQNNKMSGSIPDAYGGTPRLRYWDTFDNKLTGDLPASVWNLKGLEEFYIQNEHLDVIRNFYCKERIEQSAMGRKHNYAELGSTHWQYQNARFCVNPHDTAGAFSELSGDV